MNKITQNNDVAIINLEGRMSLDRIAEIEALFYGHFEKGIVKYIFNMWNTLNVSSNGVGLLFDFYKKVRDVDGNFALTQLSPTTKYILKLIRLDDFFPVYKNNQQALKSFMTHSGAANCEF